MAIAKTSKPSSEGSERGRRALVVCGMHRSGTSALTRVFSLLGAELPRGLVTPAADNPRGYWESQAINDLNARILSSALSSWDDAFAIEPDWFGSEEALAFREPARALLEREFAVTPLLVLKDPRIGRLLPIWLPAFEEIGIEPAFVLTLRNPLEVAESLRRRDGFPTEKSVMTWLRHLLEAERATRLYRRTFVSFGALIDDWRLIAKQVARELELTWPHSYEEAQEDVDAFLSRELRHHSRTPGALEAETEIVDWIQRAYEAALSRDLEEEERRALLDSVAAELGQADKAFGPLTRELRSQVIDQQDVISRLTSHVLTQNDALSELSSQVVEQHDALSRVQATLSSSEQRLKETEQLALRRRLEIENITGSTSWRLAAPLRAAKRYALARWHSLARSKDGR